MGDRSGSGSSRSLGTTDNSSTGPHQRLRSLQPTATANPSAASTAQGSSRSPSTSGVSTNQRSTKKTSIACTACKVRRSKCDGAAPCQACEKAGTDCLYDPSLDRRRSRGQKLTADSMSKELLKSLLKYLKSASESDVSALVESLRLANGEQDFKAITDSLQTQQLRNDERAQDFDEWASRLESAFADTFYGQNTSTEASSSSSSVPHRTALSIDEMLSNP